MAVRAFGYPFRAGALRCWIPAMLLVLVLPLVLVPLLGYTLAAIRLSAREPAAGPPALRLDRRLLRDGLLLLLALLALSAPFVLAAPATYSAVRASHLVYHLVYHPVLATHDAFFNAAYAGLVTAGLLLLPFSLVLLLLLPTNCAAFAVTGRARDLFDPVAAGRRVAASFLAWNLVTVVIATGWAIALAGAGLLCAGFIPAAVYAMLVTAHAVAILAPADSDQEGRPVGRQSPPAGAEDASAR